MEQHKQQTEAMEAILAALDATAKAELKCMASLPSCRGALVAMAEAYDALVRAGNAIGQAKGTSVAKLREEQITIHDGE